MEASQISLNPQAQFQWHYFGRASVPVLQIDRCLAQPEDALKMSQRVEYSQVSSGYYPGVRSPLSREVLGDVSDQIARHLAAEGAREQCRLVIGAACFSRATTPPAALRPIQTVPHFDDVNENQWAVVIFLCDEQFGGTGFYRHRTTGIELMSGESLQGYAPQLKREVMNNTQLHRQYINNSNALFERTGCVDAHFNRAVCYPSRCLHSGLIAPPAYKPVERSRAGGGHVPTRVHRTTLNLLISVTQEDVDE